MKKQNQKAQVSESSFAGSPVLPFIYSEDHLLVNAYHLYHSLKIKTPLHKWIERRIEEYDFKETQDFWTKLSVRSDGKKGRRRVDYHLTLDMAKELAMVERTPVGRRIRQYFIAAEQELVQKRLYGQHVTMSQLKSKVSMREFNGDTVYHVRDAQRALGYSTKSSLSNIRRCYANQLLIIDRNAYISEAYLKLMITRATALHQATITKEAQPLLPLGFGGPIAELGESIHAFNTKKGGT